MAQTLVTKMLKSKKIDFSIFEYEYDPDDMNNNRLTQEKLIDINRVFKTLVGQGDKTGIIVAIISTQHQLNLKALAKASDNKKFQLLPVKELQAKTGYIRGGCSPLGMTKNYPTYIDTSCLLQDKIYVNAGKRGLLIEINPNDLIALTNAKVQALHL